MQIAKEFKRLKQFPVKGKPQTLQNVHALLEVKRNQILHPDSVKKKGLNRKESFAVTCCNNSTTFGI